MLGAGRALGNEELKQRLNAGNASREEMLAYLVHRLESIREAQLREMKAGSSESMEKDGKKIADSHKDAYAKPEPTRWRESARIYEQAAYHLARGALRRGAELVDRALQAERKAFAEVGKNAHAHDLEPDEHTPEVFEAASAGLVAAAEVPPIVGDLVQLIENVTADVKDPTVKLRTKDPQGEDEEEDEEPGGKPVGGGAA